MVSADKDYVQQLEDDLTLDDLDDLPAMADQLRSHQEEKECQEDEDADAEED